MHAAPGHIRLTVVGAEAAGKTTLLSRAFSKLNKDAFRERASELNIESEAIYSFPIQVDNTSHRLYVLDTKSRSNNTFKYREWVHRSDIIAVVHDSSSNEPDRTEDITRGITSVVKETSSQLTLVFIATKCDRSTINSVETITELSKKTGWPLVITSAWEDQKLVVDALATGVRRWILDQKTSDGIAKWSHSAIASMWPVVAHFRKCWVHVSACFGVTEAAEYT